jgi:putative ABC transport system permease protein
MTRPPVLVRLALRLVGIVSVLVPRAERQAWRREWEAELLHGHRALDRGGRSTLGSQAVLGRRALGSIVDAAWLRRQMSADSELLHDVKYALRLARARPAFTLFTAGILAIGIGATTTVVTMMDRLVLRALPFDDQDRLVSLWQRNGATGNMREEVSPGNFLEWRARSRSFERIAAAEPYSVDYTTSGAPPEVVLATRVSEGFFDLLRVQPVHGRLFIDDDHRGGSGSIALISHAFWTRLGGDPAIVGRPIELDGAPVTVVGVLPKGADLNLFDGRDRRDVFFPKVFEEYERNIRGEGWWTAIGRLADGASRQSAQAELDTISRRLAQEQPRTNASTTVGLEPLQTALMRTVRPALAVMLAAALLVLLIACANVANLMLVRGAERAREFALRGALGASRARLARQLLTETATIAVAGTAAGVGLAWATLRAVVSLSPTRSPRFEELVVDWPVVLTAAAIGAVTALLFGLVPALRFSRRARLAAGDSRGETGTRGARSLRDGLVVSEVAVAVVLAVLVGLLARSFVELVRIRPGFDGGDVAVLQVFAGDRNETEDKLRTFIDEVSSRFRQIPGVVLVGAVSAMPFIEANISIQSPMTIQGRPPTKPGEGPTTFLTVATPEYFDIMRIPVIEGRGLTAADRSGVEAVAVISATLARRYWPDGTAVGARVQFPFRGRPQTVRIVGVVGEVRHDALELPPRDELFVPFAQSPFGSITFVLRAAVDPATVIEPATRALWSLDPLQTVYDAGTVRGLLSASVAPRRFTLVLSGAFAAVALLLAALGIYAVMAISTRQRTREIGVRVALGASRREITRLIVRRGLALAAGGLAIGLVLAVGAGTLLRSQLFEVQPLDPLTLVSVAGLVLAVGVVASYAPAQRAARVDPIVALRDN